MAEDAKVYLLKRALLAEIIFVMILVLAGCGGDNSDLKEYVDDVKSRPGRKIEPLPEPKKYSKYKYTRDKRDSPFLKVFKKIEGVGEQYSPDINRPKQPLESYPLDSLTMVGKVKISGIDWALIESADGRVHRIRTGQYMGKNYGKVIKITPQLVLIEETYRLSDKWKKREASLKLRTGEEGDS